MMKKVLLAACSICLAAVAAAAPLSAVAAEEITVPEYPEIFDDSLKFDYLMDFAVANDNLIAFADGTTIVRWANENTTVYGDGGENGELVKFDKFVTDVDYENGNFYYSLDGGETSYILPDSPKDLPGQPAQHNFDSPKVSKQSKDFNGYFYYYLPESPSELKIFEKESEKTTTLILYNAKVYGDKLYAIQSNEILCEVTGANAQPYNVAYSNYEKLTNILLGDAPQKLNTYSTFGENPKIVNIESGCTLTEFNLDSLATITAADKHFPITLSQAKSNTYTNFTGGEALLLCQTGKIRIVAQGTRTFIINADYAKDLSESDGKLVQTSLPDGAKTAVKVAGEYAHSLPFMSNATRTFPLAANEQLTVVGMFSKDLNEVLAHDFYLIENSKGERGFVAAKFLNKIDAPIVNEGDPTGNPDPDYSTANAVRTVIIIIVVIALVLIAAGYLTWLCTAGKRKKSAKKDDVNLDDPADENTQDKKE